jgi:hypothetical protein
MPDDSPAGTSTYGEENASPVTVTKTKTSVTAPAKPKADAPYSKPAGNYVNPEKGLERVHPEDYINPAGFLKGMFKQVVNMGAKRTAKEAAEGAAKNVTRKSEEGFNPSEALEKLKPTRNVSVKGKEIPVRQGTPSFNKSSEGMGVKDVTNKSGQKIPVKRQADDMVDDGGSGIFKRGGTVSKADMKKAGFYDKGKTKSERQKIVSKVTTKPQRVAIVEKAFSTKNMKAGGMASRRADGCAVRGKTRA